MAIVNKEYLVGTVMDFCPFGTVISNDTVGVDFKPTAESTDWLHAGRIVDFKVTPQTEDDSRTAFDRATLSYVTEKNTHVTGNTIELNCLEMNHLFWEIVYQTAEGLTAGEEVQPFAQSSYGKKMWVRLKKYQEDKSQMLLLEVAGTLKIEVPTENNKLITPKVTLEVIASELNSLTPTAAIAPETAA